MTFHVPPDYSASDLRELFDRIAQYCRQSNAAAAIVHVFGQPALSAGELLDAMALLAQAGCGEGFRLAWIAEDKGMFHRIAKTEPSSTQSGILSRVFFVEQMALRWLDLNES